METNLLVDTESELFKTHSVPTVIEEKKVEEPTNKGVGNPVNTTIDTTIDTSIDTTVQEEKKKRGRPEKEKVVTEEATKPTTLINEFTSKYGFIEEGEEVDDTVEGLHSYFDKVVEKTKAQTKQEAIDELFETKPELHQYNEYLEKGYQPSAIDEINQLKQIDNLSVTEDEEEQKNLIRMSLQLKGLKPERINKIIEASVYGESLKTDAEESLAELKEYKDTSIKNIEAKEQYNYQKAQEENKVIENNIKNIIDSGKIVNLQIPNSEKEDFKKFILNFDKEGLSERDRKVNQLSLDHQVLIDWLMFKNFNISASIQSQTNLDQKKSLSESLKKREVPINNGGGNSTDKIVGINDLASLLRNTRPTE